MLLDRLVVAMRIGEMPVGLCGAVHLGFSPETGAVRSGTGLKFKYLSRWAWQPASSGFLSVGTRFGPFFLALGSVRTAWRLCGACLPAHAITFKRQLEMSESSKFCVAVEGGLHQRLNLKFGQTVRR